MVFHNSRNNQKIRKIRRITRKKETLDDKIGNYKIKGKLSLRDLSLMTASISSYAAYSTYGNKVLKNTLEFILDNYNSLSSWMQKTQDFVSSIALNTLYASTLPVGVAVLSAYYLTNTDKKKARTKQVLKKTWEGAKKTGQILKNATKLSGKYIIKPLLYNFPKNLITKTTGRFLLTTLLISSILYNSLFLRDKEILQKEPQTKKYSLVNKLSINSIGYLGYLNNLYSVYLTGGYNVMNIENILMDTIDFKKSMNIIYNFKINNANKNSKKEIEYVFNNQVKKYLTSTPTRMSLDDYLNVIDSTTSIIRENIDWNKVKKVYKGIDDKIIKIAKKVSKEITPLELTAYSLTELMPYDKGMLNIAFLDDLLENAGEEFIYLIPSFGDRILSFGPYQLTNYAVQKSIHKNGELYLSGASKINYAIPKEYQIPDSLKFMDGRDHHKAGYMFALNNIIMLLRELNDEELEKFNKKINKKQILEYISIAHHKPVKSRELMKEYLGSNLNKSFFNYLCDNNKDEELIKYAHKTLNNYEALSNSVKITK